MTQSKIFEYFNETGEEITRDLTLDEIQQKNADAETYTNLKAERESVELAKATAKASAVAKLEAIGLTADEIAALRG